MAATTQTDLHESWRCGLSGSDYGLSRLLRKFSMNGSRGRSNNFLLDGTDMNDGFRNDPAINQAGVFGDPATILPLDAVAEVKVLSNFQPEYGRNAAPSIEHRHQERYQCTARELRSSISATMQT